MLKSGEPDYDIISSSPCSKERFYFWNSKLPRKQIHSSSYLHSGRIHLEDRKRDRQLGQPTIAQRDQNNGIDNDLNGISSMSAGATHEQKTLSHSNCLKAR
jgi:hypothetical protein